MALQSRADLCSRVEKYALTKSYMQENQAQLGWSAQRGMLAAHQGLTPKGRILVSRLAKINMYIYILSGCNRASPTV